jgi:hypothetical protein
MPILLDRPRNVQTRIVHPITGHGHIGAYYCYFVLSESLACPYGEPLQLRSHVLTDCDRHDTARHHLHKASSDLPSAFILSAHYPCHSIIYKNLYRPPHVVVGTLHATVYKC